MSPCGSRRTTGYVYFTVYIVNLLVTFFLTKQVHLLSPCGMRGRCCCDNVCVSFECLYVGKTKIFKTIRRIRVQRYRFDDFTRTFCSAYELIVNLVYAESLFCDINCIEQTVPCTVWYVPHKTFDPHGVQCDYKRLRTVSFRNKSSGRSTSGYRLGCCEWKTKHTFWRV